MSNFEVIWNEASTVVHADGGLEGNQTHRAPEVIVAIRNLMRRRDKLVCMYACCTALKF